MSLRESFQRAADAIRAADALLITAGAGMGVDSGLPDFRGKEGFWEAYPPIARLGKSFVEMANPRWFDVNPVLAWAFYGHRLNLYRETAPHRGFFQLLEITGQKRDGCFVFTSNVDGQFQKAGYPEDRIEECHGSIHYFQCARPCGEDIWDASGIMVDVDIDKFEARDPLPACPNCGATARPNILLFGDWSWIPHRTDRQSHRLAQWLGDVVSRGSRLAVIEMGAGKAVATVRHQSEYQAGTHNATLIRINPRDHDIPAGRHIALPLGAADGVNGICEQLESRI